MRLSKILSKRKEVRRTGGTETKIIVFFKRGEIEVGSSEGTISCSYLWRKRWEVIKKRGALWAQTGCMDSTKEIDGGR